MKKVTAFKDSNGKLHENYSDYVKSEVKILQEKNIEIFQHFVEAIKKDGVNFYHIMNKFREISLQINDKSHKEDYEKMCKLYRDYKVIIAKENKRVSSDNANDNFGEDNSNYNSSPGFWRGITAQDIIGF
jgi:hypothetical protein